jgi:hypothetical protein
MTIDDDIATLLYQETEVAPPSAVDLTRVVRDGRRRRRVRVLVPSAAVAVLVLAVVTTVSTVALRSPSAPAGPAPVPAPSPSPTTAAAPAELDPLVLRIETGWNPDQLPETTPLTSTVEQVVQYAGSAKMFDISLYAAGQVPWQLRDVMPSGIGQPSIVDEPAVRGRPAKRIVFGPGAGSSSGLAWQWADGAWAVARARAGYAAEQEQVERLLAENLRTDVSRPVQLPFRLTAPLPPGVRLVETNGQAGNSDPYGNAAGMGFGSGLTAGREFLPNTAIRPAPVLLAVTVSPVSAVRKPTPNTTVDGHPAYVSWADGHVSIFGLDGFDVVLTAAPQGLGLTQEQAVTLARSVRRS